MYSSAQRNLIRSWSSVLLMSFRIGTTNSRNGFQRMFTFYFEYIYSHLIETTVKRLAFSLLPSDPEDKLEEKSCEVNRSIN